MTINRFGETLTDGVNRTTADYVSAFRGGAPVYLKLIGPGDPLTPQSFGTNIGQASTTEQQPALSAWLNALLAEKREGYLPRGIYRLSGSTAVNEVYRFPVTIRGEGPRRAIIWMDDTYTAGAALRFRDHFWAIANPDMPNGVVPESGYEPAFSAYSTGQSWNCGLNLSNFSIVGQLTNLTTGEWLADENGINLLDQRGIDFINRADHILAQNIFFGNIAGSAVRITRTSGFPTSGIRECKFDYFLIRQCGWGSDRPAFDLQYDGTGGGGSNLSTFTRFDFGNCHGTNVRIEGFGNTGSVRENQHFGFRDIILHSEASWNVGDTGYDPSVPIPGGAYWHGVEILGACHKISFQGVKAQHSLGDKYVIHVASAHGQTPFGIEFVGTASQSAENLALIEGGTGVKLDFMSTEGGLITVGPGVTGPVQIDSSLTEVTNLVVDESVRHLVTVNGGWDNQPISSKHSALAARGGIAVGSMKTFAKRTHVLYAQTSSTATTAGFSYPRDGIITVLAADGLSATPIRVHAATYSLMVYRVVGHNTASQRAEWSGVVLVHRLTNAASTTIVAGAVTNANPDSSNGTVGNASRLTVSANTTIGGVDFSVSSWAGVGYHTLWVEEISMGLLATNNLASIQLMLLKRGASMMAALSDPAIPGPYADDTAAGVGGVTSGGKYFTVAGKIATKT